MLCCFQRTSVSSEAPIIISPIPTSNSKRFNNEGEITLSDPIEEENLTSSILFEKSKKSKLVIDGEGCRQKVETETEKNENIESSNKQNYETEVITNETESTNNSDPVHNPKDSLPLVDEINRLNINIQNLEKVDECISSPKVLMEDKSKNEIHSNRREKDVLPQTINIPKENISAKIDTEKTTKTIHTMKQEQNYSNISQDGNNIRNPDATEEFKNISNFMRINKWYTSQQIAEHITLQDIPCFKYIDASEFFNRPWDPSGLNKNTPTLTAFLQRFEKIENWVVAEYLRAENNNTKSKVICRFIRIAHSLYKIYNEQSTVAIMFGLQDIQTRIDKKLFKRLPFTEKRMKKKMFLRFANKAKKDSPTYHHAQALPYLQIFLDDLQELDLIVSSEEKKEKEIQLIVKDFKSYQDNCEKLFPKIPILETYIKSIFI